MAERKSLKDIKPRSNTRRAKPLVAKAGFTRSRTPYKYGGQKCK